MKHLKSINEAYQVRDIEDFVRNHLAYLLDEGYEVNTNRSFANFIKTIQ